MRIYLDTCCFNRPYDDLRDNRVRMEAEAVFFILELCEDGRCEFCGSDILLDEINNAGDFEKRQKILLTYQKAALHVDLTVRITARAKELAEFGIKTYDSLHLASAEAGGVDVFLTTDHRLIRAASRADAKIKVMNPLIWLAETLV